VDLNTPLLRTQIATIRADAAPRELGRVFHLRVADGPGRFIAAHQHVLGAAAACSWTAKRHVAARTK
jgi:hypothetical protein